MQLEHVNVTVPDPKATAVVLSRLFGWHIRWEGEALNKGYTVHVGSEDAYLALYAPRGELGPAGNPHRTQRGLNHIGIVVNDLEETEGRIKAEGFDTFNHADYEPGRRFYFDGPDGIEYEVVSYS